MAKHSVPKRKQSKTRSGRRYKTFANGVRTRLLNDIQLAPCDQCGAMKKLHHACPQCGMYAGRSIIDKEKAAKKITKIQA